MSTGVEDLAGAIVDRRAELGWSQRDLIEKSGVSKNVVQALEGAEERSYRPANKRAVEDALGWVHGSIDAVLTQSGAARVAESTSVVEQVFDSDPNHGFYTKLGIQADRVSQDADNLKLGASYIVGVLRKHGLVEISREDPDQGSRHAM